MIQVSNFLDHTQAGIYGIKNIVTNKWYVGSANCNGKRSIGNRLREHVRLLARNKHFNRHLQYSWHKYGHNSFNYFIIEITDNDQDLLHQRERHWMKELNVVENGYNIATDPSRPMMGVEFSESHKSKIAAATKERMNRPEEKEKFSRLAKERMALPKYKKIAGDSLRKCWGIPELREKFIVRHKGKIMSNETRKKLHDAHQGKPKYKLRGRPLSQETKRKLSESMKGKPSAFKGRTHSDEYKKKHTIWTKEKVLEELKILIDKLGCFPRQKDMQCDLRNGYKKYGDINYYKQHFGFSIDKKSKGYWTDATIEIELDPIVKEHKQFSNVFLRNIGRNDLCHAIQQNGGFKYWRSKITYLGNYKCQNC